MTHIIVRIMTPEDEAGAREAWSSAMETLRQTYRPIEGAIGDWKPPGKLTSIVAILDGRVAGTASYYPDDDRLHLMRFGVHADFRRKGVARAMVEHVMGIAQDRDFCRLSVYTVKECGVVPVYEKLGFKVCREEHAKWAESDKFQILTDVYMEATLTGASSHRIDG